jgi:hypothetical protein
MTLSNRVSVDADALNDLLNIASDHIKMLGQVNRVRASVRALPDVVGPVKDFTQREIVRFLRNRPETEDPTTI